ncbi:hypothetical protein GCM10027055_00590 [Janibacter alkaliphilus]
MKATAPSSVPARAADGTGAPTSGICAAPFPVVDPDPRSDPEPWVDPEVASVPGAAVGDSPEDAPALPNGDPAALADDGWEVSVELAVREPVAPGSLSPVLAQPASSSAVAALAAAAIERGRRECMAHRPSWSADHRCGRAHR